MDSQNRTLSIVIAVSIVLLGTLALSLVGRTEPDLSEAVVEGNHAQVALLLDRGLDPDRPLVGGFTPLMRSAVRNDAAMVRLLAHGGADLEATAPAGGLNAMHGAAIADAPDAILALIESGASVTNRSRSGRSALDHAAAAGSVDAITVLVGSGVDLDETSAVYVQLAGYPTDFGPTPLAIAARAGHLDAVQVLLEGGALVDGRSARGQTALLQAVASGQPAELVDALLEAGADPEVRSTCTSACPGPDTDALGWARRLSSPAVVELLEADRRGHP